MGPPFSLALITIWCIQQSLSIQPIVLYLVLQVMESLVRFTWPKPRVWPAARRQTLWWWWRLYNTQETRLHCRSSSDNWTCSLAWTTPMSPNLSVCVMTRSLTTWSFSTPIGLVSILRWYLIGDPFCFSFSKGLITELCLGTHAILRCVLGEGIF